MFSASDAIIWYDFMYRESITVILYQVQFINLFVYKNLVLILA